MSGQQQFVFSKFSTYLEIQTGIMNFSYLAASYLHFMPLLSVTIQLRLVNIEPKDIITHAPKSELLSSFSPYSCSAVSMNYKNATRNTCKTKQLHGCMSKSEYPLLFLSQNIIITLHNVHDRHRKIVPTLFPL
jgi:hypothetical protein